MRLKLIATKNVIANDTAFHAGDKVYASVHDDGKWFLSQTEDGVYDGPFDVYYLNGCFISDFDKAEYEKYFMPIQHVKMFNLDGNLVAEAEHGIANFI